jgi:hypothetical protein
VYTKSFEDERELSPCFPEKGAKTSVGEATDVKLATQKRMKELQVVAMEQIEAAIRALTVRDRAADLVQVSASRGRGIEGRNELQVALVSASHENAKGWEAIDRFPHWSELHLPTAVAMFHPTVVFEKSDISGGGFDSQDLGKLVVHFDDGRPHLVSDASTLYTGIQIVADFALVVARQLASQECGDVLGFRRVNNRAGQGFIEFV